MPDRWALMYNSGNEPQDVAVGKTGDISVRDVELYMNAQRSGIDYVIINGTVIIDKGENTGALPGRGLRRGHAST